MLADLDLSKNQAALRLFIMEERARKFVGEFQRKWDLDRWGKRVEPPPKIPRQQRM